MIKINGKQIELGHFPDGTLLLKSDIKELACDDDSITIKWNYENNEELVALYFLTNNIKASGFKNIILDMPYIPNARQDRVKNDEDVFTLKYFAQMLNSLSFSEVRVLDAHSNVSLALIDNVKLVFPKEYIYKVIEKIKGDNAENPLMFYPDEGASKRYSGMIPLPYCFGIKNRDWSTGQIKSLSVSGEVDRIKGNNVLIVDDICSFGGTFYFSAQKLTELGAKKIYLFISHCEKSILNGKLINCELINKIYTTDSIYNCENKKIEIVTL